ncbi:FosX/FosE/FosI family fosfomycin resistance hydrolase [Rhizobium sp. PL01]|uniref:FosX/FosE/FosI family fosfomycin resistance hydrolase n=1 Tax=Rhizobium sp. PL01 TaxID=3085631 RepID=UPI00298149B7|nr:FosX/FosE/FosI family fosfomycin resistance hydrolase [Rhizobium sp. PL01]MDW5315645.1 FosX/FosE/FosI family fosfomycin resistance hydrolase [Rhizobium sp. PL01]
MIEDISHITFTVSDLDRMTDILETVFDAKEVYASGEKPFSHSPEKFFTIGDLWIAIMQGKSLSERTYNHVAFKIRDEDVDLYLERIRSLGLDLMPPRPRVEGEGRSIYFHDADNHLFELHAGTLAERLDTYSRLKEAAE